MSDDKKDLEHLVRAQLNAMTDELLEAFMQQHFKHIHNKLPVGTDFDQKVKMLLRKATVDDVARAFGPDFAKDLRAHNELLILLLSPPKAVPSDGPAHVTAINRAFLNLRNGLFVRIRQSVAGTLHDIGMGFEENLPRAVHIVTHGNREAIEINDGNDQPTPLNPEALVERFHLSLPLAQRSSAKLAFVTLGACYSDLFANKLVPDMAQCAIGLSGLISPDAALCFYTHFYQALAGGKSVADAFKIARLELDAAHSLGNRPHLVDPNGVADDIYFPQRNPGRFFGPQTGPIAFTAYLGTVAFAVWWLLEQFT